MIDCARANELLDAWIDGEIEAGNRTALEAHLAGCAECRATADLLRSRDADLRRAFAPERRAAQALAERVSRQLPETVARPAVRNEWLPLLVALAAGFLLAVFVFRPWRQPRKVVKEILVPAEAPRVSPSPQAVEKQPLVQLAVATGPVEVLPANTVAWYACPAQAEIEVGSCVRTGPDTRCEFATADGSQLRLNTDTEVRMAEQGQMELTKGRVWSCVREGAKPLLIKTADATVTAEQCQLDLARSNGEAVLTVLEGTATVRDRQGERTVAAGQRVTLVDGQVAENQRVDALLDTSWVHEVLALKGRDDPEYSERIKQLLARIGDAKLSYCYEEEIRRQGDFCVPPLVRYIQSPDSQTQSDKRRRAARIVADVAQPRSIPELVELLSDEDAFVRRSAAEGLLRLTNHDQGRPPGQWQSESATACEPTVKIWQNWLDRERSRIPGTTPLRSKDLKDLQKKG